MAETTRGLAEVVGRVAVLRCSPVKGLAQDEVASLELDDGGVRADRRFAIVARSGRALYTPEVRALAGARAHWDEATDVLAIRFADGETVEAPAAGAAPVRAHGYGRRPMPGRDVPGPFAAALSGRLGKDVTLVRLAVGVGAPGPVTLLGRGSLARLAAELGRDTIDARRFKMTVELDGPAPEQEDTWAGRVLHIGEARLRVGAPVGRCVLTTLDPDTLRRDLDTMRALMAYRAPTPSGEPPFGMYATVERPGRIGVGDAVELQPPDDDP